MSLFTFKRDSTEGTQEKISEKSFSEFVDLVSRLEPIEFIAITKIYKIPIVITEELKEGEEGKPKVTERPFDEILADVLDNFIATGRNQRRQIMKMLREVVGHKKA